MTKTKRLLLALSLFCLPLLPAVAQHQTNRVPYRILIAGDSLGVGYCMRASGYVSCVAKQSVGLRGVPEQIHNKVYDVLVVSTGTNEASWQQTNVNILPFRLTVGRLIVVGPPCTNLWWDRYAAQIDKSFKEQAALGKFEYISLRDLHICTRNDAHPNPWQYERVWEEIARVIAEGK